MTEGFDVGLEMSGNPSAFRDMLDNMAHGGKISMLGIPAGEMAIDWNKVIFNMLTLKGIYGREIFETWYKMTVMIQSGLDLAPIITHRLPYQGIRARLRGDAPGRYRQGRSQLGVRPGRCRPAPSRKTRGCDVRQIRTACRGRARRDPRGRLLQDRAGDHDAAGQPCRGPDRRGRDQPVRQQLSRPRPGRAGQGGGDGGARALGLRHGLGALHLRHPVDPQAARGAALRLARDGGHDPLSLLLRRQWRPLRDPARARGRGDLRRAQPRLDHRRRAALQGAALPLQECRHGRPRGAAAGRRRRRRALQADRHRRRLLDGRLYRPARARSATSPSATARSSMSTTATPPAWSAPAAAARPSIPA